MIKEEPAKPEIVVQNKLLMRDKVIWTGPGVGKFLLYAPFRNKTFYSQIKKKIFQLTFGIGKTKLEMNMLIQTNFNITLNVNIRNIFLGKLTLWINKFYLEPNPCHYFVESTGTRFHSSNPILGFIKIVSNNKQ